MEKKITQLKGSMIGKSIQAFAICLCLVLSGFTLQAQVTFNYTGGVQTFTVPAGVTSIDVDAYGAAGFGLQGYGGRVQATLPVTPGEVLNIYVGGAGTESLGGYNGGGNAGANTGYASGGGATDIRRAGTALANRIIVAGGGGGSGSNCGTWTAEGGHGGGLVGGAGCVFSCSDCQYTGYGGTQSAGGVAGPTGHGSCGGNTNGSLGQGGSNTGGYGTGGGGGYYGGGSGCFEGAGGGSSYTDPTASNVIHTQGVRQGNGVITISYAAFPPCTSPSNVTASPAVFCAGSTVNLTAISAGNNLEWYTAPSGGTAIGTSASGANFAVTPATTTTYYVQAVGVGGSGTQTFNPVGVVEYFVVPAGVTSITIDAAGAQGGNTNGGLGARIMGTFTVTPGESLGVAVGRQGVVNNCGGSGASGGGGGGSFVWKVANSTQPLVAAGGGGGGNTNWTGGCIAGMHASITTSGTQGNGPTSALGGSGGQGGAGNAPSGTGAGGGGWLSAGQNSTYDPLCTGGASAFTFLGGNGSPSFGPGGQGGFGGGGGAVCGCGGGGGYSGGGGGEGSSCRAGGGGGGSYNAGTNPTNTAQYRTGDGIVILTWGGASCSASPRIAVTATLDNVAPVATCQNITVQLNAQGQGSASATQVNNGSTDNCSIASVTLSDSIFDCSEVGANSITLSVTDGANNVGTCTATITVESAAPSGVITAPLNSCGFNITCPGGNTGSAQITPNAGCGPYSYVWSHGDTASFVSGLMAGTYTVTITGPGGTDVETVVLTEPSPISISPSLNGTCVGDSTGAIDITVTGGNTCGTYTYLWSNGSASEDLSNLTAGSYTVTVTDSLGCATSQTFTVASNPSPSPVITQTGNTLETSQGYLSYQWLFNSNTIPGANAFSHVATANGDYTVVVTDSNGCEGSTTINVVLIAITDPLLNGISISPNPSNGLVVLRTSTPILQTVTISITDIYGRQLKVMELDELQNEISLDLSNLAKGTYLVDIRNQNGGNQSLKVVIQ